MTSVLRGMKYTAVATNLQIKGHMPACDHVLCLQAGPAIRRPRDTGLQG